MKKKYVLEFFEFLVEFGFNGVKDIGRAVILSGNSVKLVKRVDGQEADEEGSEKDNLHFN